MGSLDSLVDREGYSLRRGYRERDDLPTIAHRGRRGAPDWETTSEPRKSTLEKFADVDKNGSANHETAGAERER